MAKFKEDKTVRTQWLGLKVGETLRGVPAVKYGSVAAAICREKWARPGCAWATKIDRVTGTFSVTRVR